MIKYGILFDTEHPKQTHTTIKTPVQWPLGGSVTLVCGQVRPQCLKTREGTKPAAYREEFVRTISENMPYLLISVCSLFYQPTFDN